MGYKIHVLSSDDFDKLPASVTRGSDISGSLGFADPYSGNAYVRNTEIHDLNKYLITHEMEELVASESAHEDENGIRHKRGFLNMGGAKAKEENARRDAELEAQRQYEAQQQAQQRAIQQQMSMIGGMQGGNLGQQSADAPAVQTGGGGNVASGGLGGSIQSAMGTSIFDQFRFGAPSGRDYRPLYNQNIVGF